MAWLFVDFAGPELTLSEQTRHFPLLSQLLIIFGDNSGDDRRLRQPPPPSSPIYTIPPNYLIHVTYPSLC